MASVSSSSARNMSAATCSEGRAKSPCISRMASDFRRARRSTGSAATRSPLSSAFFSSETLASKLLTPVCTWVRPLACAGGSSKQLGPWPQRPRHPREATCSCTAVCLQRSSRSDSTAREPPIKQAPCTQTPMREPAPKGPRGGRTSRPARALCPSGWTTWTTGASGGGSNCTWGASPGPNRRTSGMSSELCSSSSDPSGSSASGIWQAAFSPRAAVLASMADGSLSGSGARRKSLVQQGGMLELGAK
mmetsp:Transcript_100935/g.320344  ORF Transcript_100935/g.320344 Transcript_100935/m.320344 type:complete len:248 (-) Transcript_100935:8-751(-)